MSDNRPRANLNGKAINLAQLDAELGNVGLCASATEVVAAERASVTKTQLELAVAAHVPNPDFGKPPEDVEMSKVRVKAQAVAAGTDTFTAAQVQKILANLVLRATR